MDIGKVVHGVFNRILQIVARFAPGAKSFRIYLHRLRGVTIGKNVFISYDVILETSKPYLISIGNGSFVGIGTIVIGHFLDLVNSKPGTITVKIEEDVFIGPSCVILPGVTIGRGAVVSAGSVVNRSIPPMTMCRGNPAVPIKKCGIPLKLGQSIHEFRKHLQDLE